MKPASWGHSNRAYRHHRCGSSSSHLNSEATNSAGSLVLAFSASGDDGLHGDVNHYVITFNDQALDVVANTAPQWEFPLTIATADDGTLSATFDGNTMPDGLYDIQVLAIDEAGNRSFPPTR